MRASIKGWEIDVVISDEEYNFLREGKIVGTTKVYSLEDQLSKAELQIKVGEIGKEDILLKPCPKNCYYTEIRRFDIIISDRAYSSLGVHGIVGNRTPDNPACKVNLRIDRNI